MGLGEAMIVAGVGCKTGVAARDVIAAIDTALAEHGLSRDQLYALAVAPNKAREKGIVLAAAALKIEFLVADADSLADAAPRLLTISEPSRRATGLESVSEAAALALAGDAGRLLGPRVIAGHVTCALAIGADT